MRTGGQATWAECAAGRLWRREAGRGGSPASKHCTIARDAGSNTASAGISVPQYHALTRKGHEAPVLVLPHVAGGHIAWWGWVKGRRERGGGALHSACCSAGSAGARCLPAPSHPSIQLPGAHRHTPAPAQPSCTQRDAVGRFGQDAQPLRLVARQPRPVVDVVLLQWGHVWRGGRGAVGSVGAAARARVCAGPAEGCASTRRAPARGALRRPVPPPTWMSSGTRSMSWNTRSLWSLRAQGAGAAGRDRCERKAECNSRAGTPGRPGRREGAATQGDGERGRAGRREHTTADCRGTGPRGQALPPPSCPNPAPPPASPQAQVGGLGPQQAARRLEGRHLQVLLRAQPARLDLHTSK